MSVRLGVPETMLESVNAFANDESIQIDVVAANDCAVCVIESDEHLECDLTTLYASGWIACDTARAVAGKLDISTRKMGKLLNCLDIKVRACGLGCF